MYQGYSQEMPVPDWSRENGMEDRVAFSCNETFWSQEMGQIEEEEWEHHISGPPPACQGAWNDCERLQLTQIKCGIATATVVDKISSFKYKKGNGYQAKGGPGKTWSKCSTSHPLRECPAWGKNVSSVETEIILVCVVGPDTEEIPKTGSNTNQPIERSKRRRRSRHRRHASENLEDRSRSRSTTWSAHSIEQHSFQNHPELHERLPNDLHGRHPFETNTVVSRTFHSISRSKAVASISNEMDPDGKTKIVTILNIKLPHWNGIDKIRVKVDDGAKANILPLDSFSTMFPHALDDHDYPQEGFLQKSRTKLKCYNDGKLINHGIIKLRLQHYSDESFQDHSFYVEETKTYKEIIVRQAASSKPSLVQVLCKNVSVCFSNRKQDKNQLERFLSRPLLENRWQKTAKEPESCIKVLSNHPPSSFKTMATCTCTETPFRTSANTWGRREWYKLTPFKTLDVDSIRVTRETCTETPFKTPAKNTRGRREQNRHKLTPFKTPGVNGRSVNREKDNADRVKDTVKNRGKETSFKTLGKSGRKKVSFQDTENRVSKANSLKTIEDTSKSPLHFMTFQEWVKARKANKLISFKTFDDWIKTITANCDTALKDVLSFISDKKPAVDGEKDSWWERPAQPKRLNPSNPEPSSQQTDSSSDPSSPGRPPWIERSSWSSPRRPPWTEDRSPWSTEEESPPWSPWESSSPGRPNGQRTDPHGAQKKRVYHGAQQSIPHAAKVEAEKLQTQQYITIQYG